jgi:peptidoglycan/xylan/chitin deacetylase (PgdA/CDA1 family)
MIGPAFAWAFQPRRVILCYHSVHPSHPFRSTTPAGFADHLSWLTDHCDVVPLQQLVATKDNAPTTQKCRPQVAITFDDGHADNHEFALPLLIAHGVPATFYLTTGFISREPRVVARMAALRNLPEARIQPMTWAQVEDLTHAGMEIGAHTHSHPTLAGLPADELTRELRQPKALLEQRLQRPIITLAYPFGELHRHVDMAAIAQAQTAGYMTAVTAGGRGVRIGERSHALPRFFATTSVAGLAAMVRGERDLVGLIHERMPRLRGGLRRV